MSTWSAGCKKQVFNLFLAYSSKHPQSYVIGEIIHGPLHSLVSDNADYCFDTVLEHIDRNIETNSFFLAFVGALSEVSNEKSIEFTHKEYSHYLLHSLIESAVLLDKDKKISFVKNKWDSNSIHEKLSALFISQLPELQEHFITHFAELMSHEAMYSDIYVWLRKEQHSFPNEFVETLVDLIINCVFDCKSGEDYILQSKRHGLLLALKDRSYLAANYLKAMESDDPDLLKENPLDVSKQVKTSVINLGSIEDKLIESESQKDLDTLIQECIANPPIENHSSRSGIIHHKSLLRHAARLDVNELASDLSAFNELSIEFRAGLVKIFYQKWNSLNTQHYESVVTFSLDAMVYSEQYWPGYNVVNFINGRITYFGSDLRIKIVNVISKALLDYSVSDEVWSYSQPRTLYENLVNVVLNCIHDFPAYNKTIQNAYRNIIEMLKQSHWQLARIIVESGFIFIKSTDVYSKDIDVIREMVLTDTKLHDVVSAELLLQSANEIVLNELIVNKRVVSVLLNKSFDDNTVEMIKTRIGGLIAYLDHSGLWPQSTRDDIVRSLLDNVDSRMLSSYFEESLGEDICINQNLSDSFLVAVSNLPAFDQIIAHLHTPCMFKYFAKTEFKQFYWAYLDAFANNPDILLRKEVWEYLLNISTEENGHRILNLLYQIIHNTRYLDSESKEYIIKLVNAFNNIDFELEKDRIRNELDELEEYAVRKAITPTVQ